MEFDTTTPPCMTSDLTSFGSISARERWPVILTGAIDDLHRTLMDVKDEEEAKEGKDVISKVVALKYDVQHDRQLTPIEDDGEPDFAEYNKELEQRGTLTWCNAPWLYAECYLYRRLNSIFRNSKHWKTYDVFNRQKLATFRSSRPAVIELATKYKELILQLQELTLKREYPQEDAQRTLFTEMFEICLWGNATDLSLLTSLTYEDLQKLQGAKARKDAEKNILVNDISKAFDVLQRGRVERNREPRRVDLVLDNAGFELYVDLILAGYLLSTGLATTVVLHPKSFPWFVSDVLPDDFVKLFGALRDPQAFFTASDGNDLAGGSTEPLSDKELNDMEFFTRQLGELHTQGKLIIRPNRFWTESGSYWRLPHDEPKLYDELKASELVILKGDLNYRKLTGDAHWDPTTPFTEAIGPLGSKSGLRVLALRTCKADVVVGLPAGKDEELKSIPGNSDESGKARKWAWNGKWAVVSFSDGKC